MGRTTARARGSDEDGASEEDGAGGDEAAGPGVEPSPALLIADGCAIEVLWTMPSGDNPDYRLRPFVAGEPGAFVIGGTVQRGEESSQILLKVVESEIEWTREYVGTNPPSGVSNSRLEQVVELDDGLRVIGGFANESDGAWLSAYSSVGELEWVQPQALTAWRDAFGHGNRVYTTGTLLEGLDLVRVEAFAADGATAWAFTLDNPAVSTAITANETAVWTVGWAHGIDHTRCGWAARFAPDGQLATQACTEVEADAHEIFTTAVPLADGGVIAAGSRYSTKPKDVGHISFDEPLIVVLDAMGVERSRWTPGEGVYESGRVAEMVALASGEVASIVALEDLAVDLDGYPRPVIYKHDIDGELLSRCVLDRPTIPEYGATPVGLAVDSAGDLFLLLFEFQWISTKPNDDPSDFPPVPEDFGGYSILRIVAFD